MKALVVYETEFGNTETIAHRITEGLRTVVDAVAVAVDEAPTAIDPDISVVVVGGPTHAFSMSRAATRTDAVRQGGHDPGIGIREWLASVSVPAGQRFAFFDSRVGKVRALPGSAARSAARFVRHRRLGRVLAVESFYVGDISGPVLDREPERAFAWGRMVGSSLVGAAARRA